MKVTCEYCDSQIEDTDEFCPNCGAPNAHLKTSAHGVPKTIEELKRFAEDKHLPLEKMRFFIGEDYHGPRAFGIYHDEAQGSYVVYKNKADGSRAIRYAGDDEAYAVNEIYQKMRTEVANQRNYQAKKAVKNAKGAAQTRSSKRKKPLSKSALALRVLVITIILGMVGIAGYAIITAPDDGYYTYEDSNYYLQGTTWYVWDSDKEDWTDEPEAPAELSSNPAEYYQGREWDESDPFGDFTLTQAYQTYQESLRYESSDSSSDNSWDDGWDDDDWSWGSDDSWDTGATDWDSDW